MTKKTQWINLIIIIGGLLAVFFGGFIYQPTAAESGKLLIWLNQRVYVMDIDSLDLIRVTPTDADPAFQVSPGCQGITKTPCWLVVDAFVHQVDRTVGAGEPPFNLPELAEGQRRIATHWMPDGLHVAYIVMGDDPRAGELHLFHAAERTTQVIVTGLDPTLPVAWHGSCIQGMVESCWVAYRLAETESADAEAGSPVHALNLKTAAHKAWIIPSDTIRQLRWTADHRLTYSVEPRYFHFADDAKSAYTKPESAELANTSPDARYTVYYQPFYLSDCTEADGCRYLGVWLNDRQGETDNRRLLYNLPLDQPTTGDALNFIPIWSPWGNSFVFFQQGELIHYNVGQNEGTIWYDGLSGKLRAVPIFSPNEEAVAFVDNQGQGASEYRLLVINPRLKPIEHIIDTEGGFRVLAWLPD